MLVQVEGLTFSYPGGEEVLDHVDLVLREGEDTGLIGPNGAGKSTLLLHLNGLLRGSGGSVKVDGVEVCRRSVKAIRQKVGMVFQDPDDQVFMPTVLEDVFFGPMNQGLAPEQVRQRALEALEQVGMKALAHRPPHHLSGGEKRAVALATVLAMRPRLLVLDEPSNGLDPRGRRRLVKILGELPATKLIATHDLELIASRCPRCVLMDGGRIVAEGPSRELMADAGLMEEHGLEVPASLQKKSE